MRLLWWVAQNADFRDFIARAVVGRLPGLASAVAIRVPRNAAYGSVKPFSANSLYYPPPVVPGQTLTIQIRGGGAPPPPHDGARLPVAVDD